MKREENNGSLYVYKNNMEKIHINAKNIFLSDAYTFVEPGKSVFSTEQRIEQTFMTIKTCKAVKDSFHVISEGSALPDFERKILSEHSLVLTYEDDKEVKEYTRDKQFGAMILLKKGLEMISTDDDANIFIIPARYFLVEGFSLSLFTDDIVIKKPWYAPGRGHWYGSQLIKLNGALKETFIEILDETIQLLKTGKFQDSECAMYQAFVNKGVKPTEIDKVYCGGYLGVAGKLEIH